MPNTHQPRTCFDDAALDELSTSIREHGVIQPIIVKAIQLTNWDGAVRRYELIAGERRWRASERAGLAMVPAIIRDETSDAALIELSLIENLQRADLTPLEEAAAFGQMQSELGYSYDQIGKRVGKSKGYVMNRMRLLRLDDDLRDLVAERPDTLSHIIYLEKLPPEQRADLVGFVRDDALALAELRRLVEQRLRPLAPPDSSDSFLRKNSEEGDVLLGEAPDSFLRKNSEEGDILLDEAPDSFLRKNSEEGDVLLDEAPDSFLRKNSEEGDVLLDEAPDSFLRKNDEVPSMKSADALERDIARIQRVVQRWRQMQSPSAEARQQILTAIDRLLGDLEAIMRQLQGGVGDR
ncbi:MAG: ParB/RepB/Spo0J family partition protein [Oscillochloris sp.]|nr:ParB/RepB/Spo0J family partition protein [Oscillochloris sp.]